MGKEGEGVKKKTEDEEEKIINVDQGKGVEEESDEAWLLRKKEERKLVEEGSSVPKKAKESDAHENASIALDTRVKPSKQTNVPTEEEEEEGRCVNKDDMEEEDEDEEDEEGDSSGLWAPPRQLCLAEFLPPGEFSFLPPAR